MDNFKKLADSGYFDGQAFHRIIRGFVIQGGDPNSKVQKTFLLNRMMVLAPLPLFDSVVPLHPSPTHTRTRTHARTHARTHTYLHRTYTFNNKR